MIGRPYRPAPPVTTATRPVMSNSSATVRAFVGSTACSVVSFSLCERNQPRSTYFGVRCTRSVQLALRNRCLGAGSAVELDGYRGEIDAIESLDAGDGALIEVLTIIGDQPGPTVSVLGGVHGDELEGVAAARILARRCAGSLTAGRLRIVAVANPPAFVARKRNTPLDGGNLARCFPGRSDGTVTERIADCLTRSVIAGSDLVIDLHSAGAAYSMPLFVGCLGGDDDVATRSIAAATTFGAPLGWLHAGCNRAGAHRPPSLSASR